MSDISRLFAELQQVASAVNQETEALNNRVAIIEKSLYELKLGFSHWMSQPLKPGLFISRHLGWGKYDEEWGLYVRDMVGGQQRGEPIRLRNATREDRLAALTLIPELMTELKAVGDRILKELQDANRASALRTPVKG